MPARSTLTDDELRGVLARAEVAAGADGVRVRFLRGGEHTVTPVDLRPCSFLPGERVICPWPGWGAWTCTVMSYNAAAKSISVTDGWGQTCTFSIGDVWLNPPTSPGSRGKRTRLVVTLLVAGAAVGAAVGSIVTALLTR